MAQIAIRTWLDVMQQAFRVSGAMAMLAVSGSPTNGVSANFLDNSMVIQDPVTPANNYAGLPFSKLAGATRASSATYTNSAGLIATAGVNVPRFDYNPVTLAPLGWLVEPAATNLCLQSKTLDQAPWTMVNCTYTPNTTLAPDGTFTAGTLTEDTTNATRYANQSITVTNAPTPIQRWFRQGTQRYGFLDFVDSLSVERRVVFDLQAGIVSTVSGATSGNIISYPNGWYLCSMICTPAVGTGSLVVGLSDTGADVHTYLGTSKTIFVWDGQVETGGVATSIITTTTATVTRAADQVATLASTLFNLSTTAMTLFADVDWVGGTAFNTPNDHAMIIDDGTTNNRVGIRNQTSKVGGIIVAATVFQSAPLSALGVATGVRSKVAMSLDATGSNMSLDGAAVVSGAALTVPTGMNILRIGGTIGIPGSLHIKRIMYLPLITSNANLPIMAVMS